MESKIQDTLHSFKALANSNLKLLASICKQASDINQLSSDQPTQHFQSIKHHYDQLLQASKLSIQKNQKLTAQLQDKREYSHMLRQKLQKNYDYIQSLEIEMIQTNNSLKKQRKSQRQCIQQQKQLTRLKSILSKICKKKADLQSQINQISQKHRQKNQKITTLQKQIKEMVQYNSQQQRKQLKRIIQLQKQIQTHKQSMYMLKDRSQRSVTPEKKEKSVIFQDVIMNIQQFRKSHFE